VDPFRKHLLLNGLDEIGQTLQHERSISRHETRQRERHPWLPATAA